MVGVAAGLDAAPTVDETIFTPWADPGWSSWDEWSPEVEFCQFVGTMQRMLHPPLVLETGVGIGRLTAHLNLEDCEYIGFESDPQWRHPPAHPDRAQPAPAEMVNADLVILDSEPSHRIEEIAMWAQHGKSGSTCIVHDAGNGHNPGSIHLIVRETIETTGIRGIYLANPRGGWIGQHP